MLMLHSRLGFLMMDYDTHRALLLLDPLHAVLSRLYSHCSFKTQDYLYASREQ